MIKLTRPAKPVELTPELQRELTNEFKLNGTSVWHEKFIVDAVCGISNSKCCFCECKLNEESKFLEVEHFHNKALYPDEVMEWENLLPICKRCNGIKHEHDTKNEHIVNPCDNDPREHLFFRDYRLKGKPNSLIGQRTLDVVYLNDTLKLTILRFRLGERINEELENLHDLTTEFYMGEQTSTRRKNRIKGSFKTLLSECDPNVEYAATAATILLNEDKYHQIKAMFLEKELWDDELTELENKANFCKLDKG